MADFAFDQGSRARRKPYHNGTTAWLRAMEPGESLFFAGVTATRMGFLWNGVCKERPHVRFRSRTVTEDGVKGARVWCEAADGGTPEQRLAELEANVPLIEEALADAMEQRRAAYERLGTATEQETDLERQRAELLAEIARLRGQG